MLEVRVWTFLRISILLRKFPLVVSYVVLFYVRLLTMVTELVFLSLHVKLYNEGTRVSMYDDFIAQINDSSR